MIKFTVICFIAMVLGIVANLVLPLGGITIPETSEGGYGVATLGQIVISLPFGVLMIGWIIWAIVVANRQGRNNWFCADDDIEGHPDMR